MICDKCSFPIPVQGVAHAGMVCACYKRQTVSFGWENGKPQSHIYRDFSEDEIRRIIREELRAALSADESQPK